MRVLGHTFSGTLDASPQADGSGMYSVQGLWTQVRALLWLAGGFSPCDVVLCRRFRDVAGCTACRPSTTNRHARG